MTTTQVREGIGYSQTCKKVISKAMLVVFGTYTFYKMRQWLNMQGCRRRVFEFLNSYSEAFTFLQLNWMKKYNNYHEYEEKKN